MTPTTDYVGHIAIDPVLHRDEVEYLNLFGRSFRVARPEGDSASPGLPEASSPWLASRDGSALFVDGHPECGEPTAWLRYLAAHLLRPRAGASLRERPQLEHVTFDHRLHGMVVGCRRETHELFAITARDGRIGTKVLWAAEPPRRHGVPAQTARGGDRPRTPSGYGDVIDLAARRVRRGTG